MTTRDLFEDFDDLPAQPPAPAAVQAAPAPGRSAAPAVQASDGDASTALRPGFLVVHGNRPDDLRRLLAQWLQAAPLGPLEPEVVLAQSSGVAQWLKLQLAARPAAGGLGVAAALSPQLPAQFTWSAYRAVLGEEAVPRQSPLDKPRLVWRLARLLPALLDADGFGPLRAFLPPGGEPELHARKLLQLAERVADLFDQYQVHRADWLAAWQAGRDVLPGRTGEPPLAPDERWQALLWRAVCADAGELAAQGSRAALHGRFLAACAEPGRPRPPGLPRRITVFGVSSMPQQVLEALAALARWSQVLLFVHNPCRHDWSATVPDHALLRAARHRQQPRPQPLPAGESGHPLLAAWGRQGRDMVRLLDAHDQREAYDRRFLEVLRSVDLFESHAEAGRAPTLLRRLQDDILELRPPSETRALWPGVDPADRSIAFHVAHGPQREVEVLHDQLLHAFAQDPTLTPRDVIVMVPDVAVYAPHVQAVFGQIERGDPRHIPYGIADRAQRAADPLLAALEQLLQLPSARLGAGELLDLLDVPALRARFGLRAADLPLLHRWVRQARVRWGLHAPQRAALGLPGGLEQNSWTWGLRRMLLGYATGESAPWDGLAPLDEVGGLDAALLGPLERLLERLDHHWRSLAAPATPAQWVLRLRALLADFFDAGDGRTEGLTLLRLRQALQDWQDECAEAGYADPLPLAVVREHWLARIDRPALSQPFFGGGVTVASLMPMRAIPFRVIALLGMNDGDYPRPRTPSDFDLMARELRPGDRSRREDDRYLVLEALLSAGERLHVSWVGRSIRDNEERPPSVLVAQLRDHLAACWRLDGDARAQHEAGPALVAQLTTQHRLQPFHPSYFDGSGPVSYAREWRLPAQARPAPTPATALPPALREEPLSLREVQEFLRAPVRFFLAQRLRTRLLPPEEAADDQEPFGVDGLQQWQLRDGLIATLRAAVDAGQATEPVLAAGLARIRAAGALPVGPLADEALARLAEPLPGLLQAYAAQRADWPQAEPGLLLDLLPEGLPSHLRLQDWLDGLRRAADGRLGRLVLVTSGIAGAKGSRVQGWRLDKLLPHWAAHVAAQAAGFALTTVVLSPAGVATLRPLAQDRALALWRDWMQALAQGLVRPLPLALDTACAWHAAGGRWPLPADGAAKALAAARKRYEVDDAHGGPASERRRDPAAGRAWPDFDALWSDGAFAELAALWLEPLHDALGPLQEDAP
jgi:exodeoxyribonuclease V gamma subunit